MKAIILVDLGFGDAGKGSLVDYLVRQHQAHTVIRFNGGAQAAHNVVLPDGRHHTFAQFGSGTFVPGVRTHLSRFMLFDPVALIQEERHLRKVGISDAFERLSIDLNAPVVTPFQRAANRLRELARGGGRHGSCGMGIGETMADMLEDSSRVLRVGELLDARVTREKLRSMQELKHRQVAALFLPLSPFVDREMALIDDPQAALEFADLFTSMAKQLSIVPASFQTLHAPGTVIFEGAQGVLLDEWFGFHPFTTWSTTTFANALTLLRESHYPGEVTRIGAIRTYMTRHGPGPFVSEDPEIMRRISEIHNGVNDWQRAFRMGWSDLVMLRYALEVSGGVDQIALTCVDQLKKYQNWKISRRYLHNSTGFFEGDRLRVSPSPDLEYQAALAEVLRQSQPLSETIASDEVPEFLESNLGFPIAITSHGPTHKDKHGRGVAHAILNLEDRP